MQTVTELRKLFLEYFSKQGHTAVASSPLIPYNDPSLLFVNAGMVQFKNTFVGLEERAYTRAVSSQKCVRAGGKHNDLDNVGYTARHHTFFEMLGNFSFGDYFKEEAIFYAWDLVHRVLGLPKEKLLVTVYHTDEEAIALWKKIAGLADDRIIRIATNDNFWSMGDTGPCGPCTEIFYDHGEAIAGGPPGSPNEDGDRFIEIWNLVFMQYDQQADGSRLLLPKPSIDTGSGLERLAAVLQGVHNNYDIDLFQRIIHASENLSGTKAVGEHLASHRVIADHLRAASFLISDGVLPSNEGRGYVLRRIMRRAMRHAHILGCKEPLLYRLFPTLRQEMGEAYPELVRGDGLVTETLRQEEERFRETLARGLKLLETESEHLNAGDTLTGATAFKLYDTYGFPLDLTADILRSRQVHIDQAGFDACMEEQRTMARKAWVGSGDHSTDQLWFAIREKSGGTEFLGYEHLTAEAHIVALIHDNKQVPAITSAMTGPVWLVTNQTPFYAESGGQEGDRGVVSFGDHQTIAVQDTKKYLGAIHAHLLTLSESHHVTLAAGMQVRLTVDNARRKRLHSSHSATHLLHAVLRKRLGTHITQKGSLVAEDRLRFDITHAKALTAEELSAIELEVNRLIRANYPVSTRLMTPEQAMEEGAMALFGEKYGEEVRVVQMGDDDEANRSYELCGGTHVARTGDIGLFKFVSDSAIAAGVRRIEALTGEAALRYLCDFEQQVMAISTLMKAPVPTVVERVEALLTERKNLTKSLEAEKQKSLQQLEPTKETIGNVALSYMVLEDTPAKQLRPLAENLLQQAASGVALVATKHEGKLGLVVAVSKDLTLDASALVKAMAAAAGGAGGGGSAILAQAGAPDATQLAAAMDALRAMLQAS
jgi:alanyl-tRNA synthetase